MRTGTVGKTLNLNTNTINMDTIIIIITVIIFATAVTIGLTLHGLFTDKDKDGIPDAIENKFNELKEEIKKLKK